jgi:hypothetical protein
MSTDNGKLASWGFGLINFLFAWPAVWTIDTFGRRALLLFTYPSKYRAYCLLSSSCRYGSRRLTR